MAVVRFEGTMRITELAIQCPVTWTMQLCLRKISQMSVFLSHME